MKILSLNQNLITYKQSISLKNDYKKSQNYKSESFKPVELQYLSSRFNINFASLDLSRLKESSARFEDKIANLEGVYEPNRNVALTSSDDLVILNNIFQRDGIGDFLAVRPGLNSVLNYLRFKGQLQMDGYNHGFMIDRLSIEEARKVLSKFDDKKINGFLKRNKLYCYVYDDKQAQELIDEFKKVVRKDSIDVEVIIKPKRHSSILAPNKKGFEKSIIELAKLKFPDDEESQNKFINTASKYMDEYFMPYSWASLCGDLRILHQNIEQEIQKQDKTMDDVFYVIPETYKSLDLVAYLYAMENDIPYDRFLQLFEFIKNYDENKIYVVLDDVAMSGQSFLNWRFHEVGKENRDKKLYFAPILLTSYGEKVIEEYKKEFQDKKILTTARRIVDLHARRDVLNKKDDSNVEINETQYLTDEDIQYIWSQIKGGHSDIYSAVTFPYMIPDNSSEILGAMSGHFLINNDLRANRSLNRYPNYDDFDPQLNLGSYKEIQKAVLKGNLK